MDISFRLRVWSGPDQEYISDPVEFIINVKNSTLLYGIYNEDLTLYPDTEYLVSDNFVMAYGTTLTVLPGVELYVSDGKKIYIAGDINAIGTTDNRITFASENSYWVGFRLDGNSYFEYCIFKNITGQVFQNWNDSYTNVKKSIFSDNSADIIWISGTNNHDFTTSNFIENISLGFTNNHSDYRYTYSNFTNNFGGVSNLSGNASGPIQFIASSGIFAHNNIFANIFNSIGELPYSIIRTYSGSSNITQENYFGTSNEETANNYIIDFIEQSNLGLVTANIATQPSELTNGIVWKVLVNGYDAQDEYALIDPVGIGEHEFKVYFNRAMDTSIDPQVFYGVIFPYTQNLIDEEGAWSEDGKIYTVTHDIRVGAADGINRVRVQGAMDLDNFYIPVEDSRFNFLLQSAGSASTGFFAAGGLGKIDLEWVAPTADEIDDALGYNMYRYEVDADGVESAPVKLNESLIVEDTDDATTGVYYTDYNVVEGQTYFYKYNILRTSFETTDYSSVVSAAPLTSTLGDSNGDFAVNVMDLVQNVDYILGNNPSPFIFVAGDVNNDQAINVLDIVGTVDIILNPTSGKTTTNGPNSIKYYSNTAVGDAIFSWEGNDLFVSSNYDIGGIQLAFNQDFEYTLSDNLPGVERLNYTQDDAAVLMLYSFNNTVIANAKTKILTRANASQELDINQAVVGTTNGEKLNTVLNNGTLGTIEAPFQSNKLELLKLYPNPSDGIVNLQYYLPELMDGITVKVYDIQGRLVWAKNIENQVGKTDRQLNLDALKAGNYILLMSAHKDGGVKYLSHQMLILK